jgi:hypothetical protein
MLYYGSESSCIGAFKVGLGKKSTILMAHTHLLQFAGMPDCVGPGGDGKLVEEVLLVVELPLLVVDDTGEPLTQYS